MEKLTGIIRPGQSKVNKKNSTRVIKESPRGHTDKAHSPKTMLRPKRLLMLQRRNRYLITEKESLEAKNKEILEHLQSEKMLNASLKKESFHWQRLYHESTMTTNALKAKMAEVAQVLRVKETEIDSSYPHFIHVTGMLTNIKTSIRSILSSFPPSDGEFSLQQLHNNKETKNNDLNKKSGKRMKQKVGPMVKGMPITKPSILLERIMLPLPQGEAVNNDEATVEENNQLSPISEENEHEEEENVQLSRISVRPKRKLGASWREKYQERIEKDRKRVQENNTHSSSIYNDEDFTDSVMNSPNAVRHVEPVVLLRDVSRLLQNTSLCKIDAVHTENSENRVKQMSKEPEKEHVYRQSHLMAASDDPLEGSSWMFNTIRQCNFSSSHLKSDSTDDDDDDDEIVPQHKSRNISLTLNRPDATNQKSTATKQSIRNSLDSETANTTFRVSTATNQTIRNSLDLETVNTTFSVSPPAEPDSTNNIDINLNNSSTETNSNNNNTLFTTSLLSNPMSDSNVTMSEPNINLENKSPSQPVSPAGNGSINTNNSNIRFPRKSSTVFNKSVNNFTNQPSPLEEYGKRVRKPKVHLYPGENVHPIPKKDGKQSKVLSRKKSSIDSLKVVARPSKSKNRTTVHSITEDDVNDSEIRDSKPKRNKKSICYRESPLNVKQRRP